MQQFYTVYRNSLHSIEAVKVSLGCASTGPQDSVIHYSLIRLPVELSRSMPPNLHWGKTCVNAFAHAPPMNRSHARMGAVRCISLPVPACSIVEQFDEGICFRRRVFGSLPLGRSFCFIVFLEYEILKIVSEGSRE